MDGIVILNKPSAITSFSAARSVGRLFGEKKSGHAGTLDPMAEGILVVLLGKATRLSDYMMAPEKVYDASVKLGISTDTLDIWGKVLETDDPHSYENLNVSELEQVLESFSGTSLQTPPMVSAIKVKGKKLYEYARSGQSVDIPKREITITSCVLTSTDLPDAFSFQVSCSKGTYIRSMVRDIGLKLGVHASMSALTRVKSGHYLLSDAVTLETLEIAQKQGRIGDYLRPVDDGIHYLSSYALSEPEFSRVKNGSPIDVQASESVVRLYYRDQFVALAYGRTTELKAFKVFI
jgi:tRNA pseudouridine55 synthase